MPLQYLFLPYILLFYGKMKLKSNRIQVAIYNLIISVYRFLRSVEIGIRNGVLR